jgi:hypothetical protein
MRKTANVETAILADIDAALDRIGVALRLAAQCGLDDIAAEIEARLEDAQRMLLASVCSCDGPSREALASRYRRVCNMLPAGGSRGGRERAHPRAAAWRIEIAR